MSFDTLMPLFLSTPVSEEPSSLPFGVRGGFALSAQTIGLMLSLQGLYSMLAQVFLFPFAVRRLGNLKTFRCVVIVWPLLYFLTPYMVMLPERYRWIGIYTCLLWRVTAQVLAYPSNAILLTNSAPSMLVLGVINGVAGSTASLMRAFGPTLSGLIYSSGLKMGCTGLAFWICGLVAIFGAVESMWMGEGGGRLEENLKQVEANEEDDGLINPLTVNAALLAAGRRGNGYVKTSPQLKMLEPVSAD